jgi:hypothetical protein
MLEKFDIEFKEKKRKDNRHSQKENKAKLKNIVS